MKKADIPDVMIHDIIGDVSVNITVNHGASPIPVADKFAKIVDTVCSYVSKHIGG